MPRREDERYAHKEGDPRYCVMCQKYLSREAWADHFHNPNRRKPSSLSLRLSRLLRPFRRRRAGK